MIPCPACQRALQTGVGRPCRSCFAMATVEAMAPALGIGIAVVLILLGVI